MDQIAIGILKIIPPPETVSLNFLTGLLIKPLILVLLFRASQVILRLFISRLETEVLSGWVNAITSSQRSQEKHRKGKR